MLSSQSNLNSKSLKNSQNHQNIRQDVKATISRNSIFNDLERKIESMEIKEDLSQEFSKILVLF